MIKVFEIILCMYLKTISPDVGGAYICTLYVLFITDQYQKNIGEVILVDKCCHCRIYIYIYIYIRLKIKPNSVRIRF